MTEPSEDCKDDYDQQKCEVLKGFGFCETLDKIGVHCKRTCNKCSGEAMNSCTFSITEVTKSYYLEISKVLYNLVQ